MIISRYLIKEVLSTLLAVTFILLLIFLSNQLVRFLNYAALGKIAANIVVKLMGFEIPYLLALLLPLGLYLGIILAYGRLYADNEMPVLNACGLTGLRLLMMTGQLAVIIMLLVMILMLWVNPLIAAKKGEVIAAGLAADNILDTLQPGRFKVSSDGRRVLYVERISRDRQRADNLFLAEAQKKSDVSDNNKWTVISASQGYQIKDSATQQHFIVSTEGYRYDGIPGQNDYKITKFKKYAVRLPTAVIAAEREEQEAIPTHQLWRHHTAQPALAAELQWRLAMPISVLILTLLAVPLSRIQPRQSRYAHLLPAMLIYIVYVNLLFVARNWIEQQTVPMMVGMWWVHGLLAALAVLLFWMPQGWLPFLRKS